METSPSLRELYDMLREQIRHEDELVNHRLTWLLAMVLREKWDEAPAGTKEAIDAWNTAKKGFPPITYVGNKKHNAWSTANGIPLFIIGGWICIFIIVVAGLIFG